ncbi:MAG: hypothetical protein HY020_06935 [Burkholderiales bacterium]|nr:hypothetical protein [Burkholderiales bacterium]
MSTRLASNATSTRLRRHALFGGVACALLLVLSGCSSKPSDGDAARAFNELTTNEPPRNFTVENVRRVDGYLRDDGLYVVKVQYDMVATADYEQVVKTLGDDAGDDDLKRWYQEVSALPAMEQKFGKFRKGQRFTRTTELLLRRSEAGWSLSH